MARKKLIWHFFPAFFGTGLGVLVILTGYAAHTFHSFYYSQVADDLKTRALLVQSQIEDAMTSGHFQDVDAVCKQLGAKSETRITIILTSGRPVGDSIENPVNMEDHRDRPEVRSAINTGFGTSVRFSSTVGKNMMYVAIPLKKDHDVLAVIRMSVPLTTIDHQLAWLYQRVLWAALLLAVCAALLSLYFSRKISGPIGHMKEMAKRYAGGDFSRVLPLPSAAESAELAQSLNEMAIQLHRRIEAITEDKNRIEAILFSMAEGVLALNSEGLIVEMNKAAAEYLGTDQQKAVGRTIEEILRNPEFHAFVHKTLRAGNALTEAELVTTHDGQRCLQLRGTGLTAGTGKNAGAVIVLHDVTQVHRLEEVRRDFVANVSHELKTPITSIKGFVETLREGAIENPQEAKRFLEIVARHADRLNAIVDDLLSLSRLEQDSKNRNVFFETMPVTPAIAAAVDLSAFKAEKKHTAVELFCDPAITARMNAVLIEQAVFNLIDNAIKYSPNNSTIRVHVQQTPSEIVISVTDQGSGIPEEHLGRIFERFYVVDKGRSRKLGSTGLGLSIVKHIAQVHEGRVEVQSVVGQGSTFSIHLPFHRNSDTKPSA